MNRYSTIVDVYDGAMPLGFGKIIWLMDVSSIISGASINFFVPSQKVTVCLGDGTVIDYSFPSIKIYNPTNSGEPSRLDISPPTLYFHTPDSNFVDN